MKGSNLNTGNTKFLFSFIVVLGIALIGFYNYSLIQHTSKLEHLVKFLEAQKLKVVQPSSENVTVAINKELHDTAASRQGMHAKAQTIRRINEKYLKPCAVNLSSGMLSLFLRLYIYEKKVFFVVVFFCCCCFETI